MKKYYVHFVFMALAAFILSNCGNKSVPKAYVGKWDMTVDKESSIQKTIEIREDDTFEEVWTVYDDDGKQLGELKIQGRCEAPVTEGKYGGEDRALCLIYDLKSLSDPNGILEAEEMEEYFKEENDNYEEAKKSGMVYGLQRISKDGFNLRFEGGSWKSVDWKIFEDSK